MKHIIKILFFITFLAPFFDTGLFIYTSLSQSLLWGVLSCLSLLLVCLYNSIGKKGLVYTNGIWVVILYSVYLIIHSFFITAEYYRLFYYLSGFAFLLVVYYNRIGKIISLTTIKQLLITGLIIQMIVIYGQTLHLWESKSSYFSVTGCCENPNVAAMYIALVIPFIVNEIYNKRHISVFSGLLTFSLIALYLLNCRTAWLALVIPLFIFVIKPLFNLLNSKGLQKVLIASCSISFLLFIGFLYHYKQDSADGRTLIWELSIKEIIRTPQGNGYGRFASVYNDRQSEYFRNEPSTTTERQNARYTAMAYNDYLENGVDGGIIGLLLHILLIATFVVFAYKQRDKMTFSVFLMIAIMSCVNFVTIGILPWIVFLTVAGYTLSVQPQKTTTPIIHNISYLFCILFALFLCYRQSQFILGQYLLAKPKTKESKELLSLSDFIGSSEAYHRTVAQYYIREKNWGNAILHCNEALLYTSLPSVLNMKAHALLQENNVKEAEEVLQTLRYMIPTQLKCRLQLLQLYQRHHATDKAHDIAHEILSIRPKTVSKETVRIQEAAQHYLNHIHNEYKHDK